ncbi:chemotaxis protein CheW [Evansella halocellulosilytica]|uniref:chemotaxis protein CheW n=1 Tax=Evansella halocellulosilytica TaxID=2011013 RepID=UPI000BB801A3|nr:chemotaxis protein CheW [Evansella halocellulosilytica]
MEKIIEDMKVIVFQLDNEEYGIDVQQVKSIEKPQSITRVPQAPEYVEGVINLRGIITPIIDLRKRFQLDKVEHTNHTRMIIITINDMDLGFIVDGAHDVIDIVAESIAPAPEVVTGERAQHFNGVAKLENRLLLLLNIEKVMTEEEIIEMKTMEGVESEDDDSE